MTLNENDTMPINWQTKEYLEREYVTNKKTLKNIALETDTYPEKISELLHKFGIKIRSKTENAELKLIGFVGKKFGKLMVISRSDNKGRGSRWECRCECGNTIVYTAHHLLQGHCQSCGCKRRTKYKEIPGAYFRNLKFNAKSRGLEYNLSPEYLWNLYINQNRKCALSGVDISFEKNLDIKLHTASLDRIDSSKGYIDGNVQWVHKIVNQMKWDLSRDEFSQWIRLIYIAQNGITIPSSSCIQSPIIHITPIIVHTTPTYPPEKNVPYC